MSPLQIYFWQMADTFRAVFGASGVMLLVAGMFTLPIWDTELPKWTPKVCFILSVVFLLLGIFIPTTDAIAAMFNLPPLAK